MFDELQLTTRPVNVAPFASRVVADSWTLLPTLMLFDAGATTTVSTGTGGGGGAAFTVTLAVPLFPSLVAVIVTAPAATPVTSPVADTVA